MLGVRRWKQLVADRRNMGGHCSTGQSPQWAVVPMEEEEEEEEETEEEEKFEEEKEEVEENEEEKNDEKEEEGEKEEEKEKKKKKKISTLLNCHSARRYKIRTGFLRC